MLTTSHPRRHRTFIRANCSIPGVLSKDLKAEVVEGILEIVEELKQADEQIAGYALEHIHSNEIILTHTSSDTVQKIPVEGGDQAKIHRHACRNVSERARDHSYARH